MEHCELIAIGASAGGVEALQVLVAGLPPDLPAAVVVIMHLPPGGRSFLPQILTASGPLPASEPQDGDPVSPGRIHVAPPDCHLLLANNRIRLTRGPREGRQRPSINVTFRSVASVYRHRAIGLVLTGMLDDGTAGLWEIKRCGGVAIVQDPDDAVFPSMPASALAEVAVDYRAGITELGPLLGRLASELKPAQTPAARVAPVEQGRRISGFTCPECHGPLWESTRGPLTEYRCRVGHAFTPRGLAHEQADAQETRLYGAIAAMEEGAELSEYQAGTRDPAARARLLEEAGRLRQHAADIRSMIETRKNSDSG